MQQPQTTNAFRKKKKSTSVLFVYNHCRGKGGRSESSQSQTRRYVYVLMDIILEELKKLAEQNEILRKEKAELDAKWQALQKEQERLKYLYGYLMMIFIIGPSFTKVAASSRTSNTPSCYTSGWRRPPKPKSHSSYCGRALATGSVHLHSTLSAMEKVPLSPSYSPTTIRFLAAILPNLGGMEHKQIPLLGNMMLLLSSTHYPTRRNALRRGTQATLSVTTLAMDQPLAVDMISSFTIIAIRTLAIVATQTARILLIRCPTVPTTTSSLDRRISL